MPENERMEWNKYHTILFVSILVGTGIIASLYPRQILHFQWPINSQMIKKLLKSMGKPASLLLNPGYFCG